MTNESTSRVRLVGRGSEASIYHDEKTNRVEKRFDRSAAGDAQIKAARELRNLEEARLRTIENRYISVPNPMGISEDGGSLYMEYVPGASLFWHLTHSILSSEQVKEYAKLVAEGLSLLNSEARMLQPDFTLDHVVVRAPGNITFLDFGNGSELLHGIEHHSIDSLFTELIGSTVYECSRPSSSMNENAYQQIGLFLSCLMDLTGVEMSLDVKTKSWQRAEHRMNSGSLARTVFYLLKGRYVYWKVWRALTQSSQVHSSRTHYAQAEAMDQGQSQGQGQGQTQAQAQTQAQGQANETAKSDIQARELLDRQVPRSSTRIERLFFVVSDFPEDFEVLHNGIHKAVHGLVKGISFAPNAPELSILAIGKRNTVRTEHGYTIEFLPSFRALVSFVKIKIAGSFTILNSIFSIPNSFLAHAFKWSRIPFVIAPHLELSDNLFAKNRMAKWIYWNVIDKRSLNYATAIHMLDDRQCDRLKELGISTHSFASPNGVLDSILDASPDMNWSETNAVKFHFFGRIETRTKGLDMLLTAVSAVSADHSIEVYLQGPDCGDLNSLQTEITRLRLESVVHFVDADYSTNPIDIMSQYDVFILPSRFEGFPVAAVEAMVSARPIVMTNVGGLSPIMKRHNLGIVVEPTPGDIEKGMREVISKRPTWKEDGLRAREYAITHFRWSAIGKEVLDNLQECVVDG